MAQKLTKKGRAVRLGLETLVFLSEKMTDHESIDSVVRRLVGLPPRVHAHKLKRAHGKIREFFVLTQPQLSIFSDRAEARGVALLRATRMKARPERPMKVVSVG